MVLAVTNMAPEDPHWKDLRLFARSLKPGSPEHAAAHRNLLDLVVAKETDFAPWGRRSREGDRWQDCSCGCRHFATLEGALGSDWGVCMNRSSPRAGLLTFEHQGCPEFEGAPDDDIGRALEAFPKPSK
jgi:hypothetical protein